MKKVIFCLMLVFGLSFCSSVYASPRAGIIEANDTVLLPTSPSAADITAIGSVTSEPEATDDVVVAGDEHPLVWAASGLHTDTTWMNSIGKWNKVAQTAPYFSGENSFDFLRFLGDYGAENADIKLVYDDDGMPTNFVMSYYKDGYLFQVVTLVNGITVNSSSFGAIGLDGHFYSAMLEVDYWRNIGDEAKLQKATEDSQKRSYIVDVNEGFFMTDEIFNDFILATVANSRMIYPEDTKGELIPKLCPFDGLIPHFMYGSEDGQNITCLSQKHTTMATYGSDWDNFYGDSLTTEGSNPCEDMGN